MANWSHKKLLMTLGGLALGVCGLAAGGVYYVQGLIAEVGVKVAEKSAAIAVADLKIKKVPRLEKEVIILRENLGEYVKILPDEQSLNDFVRTLQKFERQSGIRGTGLVKKNGRALKGKPRDRAKARFTPIEYTYEMTATLWQGLKFMNLIENFERFVSITEFSIGQGHGHSVATETIGGEVVHTINLTMQTYKYNNATTGKEVAIANYENRLVDLREEIWERMQAIRIDRYEHPGMQGRRDIFVDPRESGLRGGNDPSNAEQRSVLDKYLGVVADLCAMQQKLVAEGTTLFEEYRLGKRFESTLTQVLGGLDRDNSLIVYRPYRLRWAREVVAPLENLKKQAQDSLETVAQKGDSFLAMADIEALIKAMRDDCDSGQLEQARERYEAVSDRLSIPVGDPRHSMAIDAKSWHHKASTAIDFKGLDLNVQGVVVNDTGRSGVLLNGEVFTEGDYVAEDLLVRLVEQEQVWFVFRGLTLVRAM